MPLSLHVITNRQIEEIETITAASRSTFDVWPRLSVGNMIFSGVFERYPALRVGIVEFEMAWVPYFLDTMDFVYRERPEIAKYRFKNAMLPREFFHRNVFVSIMEDGVGLTLRSYIGVDNILWGSDYPHSESTWPNSQKIWAGVPEEEQRKLTYHNAAKLYHFSQIDSA